MNLSTVITNNSLSVLVMTLLKLMQSNESLIRAAQNQKLTNTGGLTKILELRIGLKVM